MGTPTRTPVCRPARSYAPTRSRGPKAAHDKFYTKPDVAAGCLERLDLDAFDRIIEPAAGDGAFSDLLFRLAPGRVRALDIVPENPQVEKGDWFDLCEQLTSGATLVVGNPPFGRQSSLAVRFINHAFEGVAADTVAFILPRGFSKQSVQNRVFRNAELVDQLELPDDAFLLHGEDYHLPSVFQIWERTNAPRPLPKGPLESEFVTFVRTAADAQFAVRRVGGRAGFAYIPEGEPSLQSNYLLRLRPPTPAQSPQPSIREVVGLINEIDFADARKGTGPNTLSKREFIRQFDAEFSRVFVR